MKPPARLSLFVVALAALFGVAFAIGSASGLDLTPAPTPTHEAEGGHGDGSTDDDATETGHDDAETGHDDGGSHGDGSHAGELPAGVLVSADGYTLSDLAAPQAAGERGAITFRILGPDGHAVTDYEAQHEKDLHLVVVSQDTTEFFHEHPVMAADGTWSVDWTWPRAGSYRVYADVLPAGAEQGLTLAQDVTVPGDVVVEALPEESRVAEVDGYTVSLTGDLTTSGGVLTLSVAHDGADVTDLDPYLGAYGHLVAIRVGDLAYLHVHPEGEVGTVPAGPDIEFSVAAPSPGTYRLFLDFSHGGEVRTAAFTVAVGAHEH